MTDAEIEAIARRYCEKLGLDPDEYNGFRLTDGGDFVTIYRWQAYTGKVREALAIQEAIAEVRGEKEVGG